MENRIRELRKSRGMNQDSLSGHVGVSQQTISKIERDISTMSVELLIGLAQYFNVTTDYILGLTDEKRNLQLENRMSRRLEDYYNLVMEYEELDEHNQRVFRKIICVLKGLQGNEDN